MNKSGSGLPPGPFFWRRHATDDELFFHEKVRIIPGPITVTIKPGDVVELKESIKSPLMNFKLVRVDCVKLSSYEPRFLGSFLDDTRIVYNGKVSDVAKVVREGEPPDYLRNREDWIRYQMLRNLETEAYYRWSHKVPYFECPSCGRLTEENSRCGDCGFFIEGSK